MRLFFTIDQKFALLGIALTATLPLFSAPLPIDKAKARKAIAKERRFYVGPVLGFSLASVRHNITEVVSRYSPIITLHWAKNQKESACAPFGGLRIGCHLTHNISLEILWHCQKITTTLTDPQPGWGEPAHNTFTQQNNLCLLYGHSLNAQHTWRLKAGLGLTGLTHAYHFKSRGHKPIHTSQDTWRVTPMVGLGYQLPQSQGFWEFNLYMRYLPPFTSTLSPEKDKKIRHTTKGYHMQCQLSYAWTF